MYSPELSAKLALYRQKVADNTITDDELREATQLLIGERKAAIENSARRRSSAAGKAPARSADDLLNELEGM